MLGVNAAWNAPAHGPAAGLSPCMRCEYSAPPVTYIGRTNPVSASCAPAGRAAAQSRASPTKPLRANKCLLHSNGRRPLHRKLQGEPKGRSDSHLALDADLPAHSFYKLFRDCETEARAAVAASDGTIGLHELLEDGAKLVRRHADAGILDRDAKPQLFPHGFSADSDHDLLFLRKLQAVGNQVGNHLSNALGIADNLGWQSRPIAHSQHQTFFLRSGRVQGSDLLHRFSQVKRLGSQ